ncbi:MAG: LysR family transcriptional regulator [Tannerellaceae bacterium]|jgi:molybdate transport system regulatory protein|nr:LysR family transcriptional regulator [Tannerellaceae bacterium]
MHRPFKITSVLEIEKNGVCFLNPKRIRLLKLIHRKGSILSASKEIGISYQQAWGVVKEINTAAPLPVVTRQRGGAHGGGAALTGFGLRMVEHYDRIQEKYDGYMNELETDVKDICSF